MSKIDFVITWVDGNDDNWIKEKNKYNPNKENDFSANRYRNWDNLKYWFRAVEKFAPWVNKIYFITCGHLPSWLNTNNEKLVIIKHSDYIPQEYLPTFNSNTIEIFMNRIENLSENFVYFNDDMFINDYVKEEDFFLNNVPRDSAILTSIIPNGKDTFCHCLLSNMNFINRNFHMKNVIKKNFTKWFNPKYGLAQIRTLLLMGWNNFPGIKFEHLPISYKKETFNEVWKINEAELTETAADRFRNNYHINHWVFQNWQLVTGNFIPRNRKFGRFFILDDQNIELTKAIKNRKYKCICINDDEEIKDFDKVKEQINNCFENKLPEKSSFEK